MKKLYFLFLLFALTNYSLSAQLVINEVLYDPPSGTAGDANGDGTRDATEDEFIEFINNSSSSLDVSGYKIYDYVLADGTRTLRHTIPDNTILPANGILVIFGGGTPTGTFGGATVIADTGSAGLSMQNSGERIEVDDASDNLILTFDSDALSNNPDESYTRDPDITGAFVQHAGVTAAGGALFSPGTLVDGSTLSNDSYELTNIGLYPNPVSKERNFITISSSSNQKIDIVIYNLLGKQVKKQSVTNNQIDISGLTAGLYIVNISQLNREINRKIMIE